MFSKAANVSAVDWSATRGSRSCVLAGSFSNGVLLPCLGLCTVGFSPDFIPALTYPLRLTVVLSLFLHSKYCSSFPFISAATTAWSQTLGDLYNLQSQTNLPADCSVTRWGRFLPEASDECLMYIPSNPGEFITESGYLRKSSALLQRSASISFESTDKSTSSTLIERFLSNLMDHSRIWSFQTPVVEIQRIFLFFDLLQGILTCFIYQASHSCDCLCSQLD